MWKKLSLKAKLIGGSCVTLILIVILSIVSINATTSLTDTAKWVDHTHDVIGQANDILASAVNMETGSRGFLLAGHENFLAPYKEGGKRFDELLTSLSNTVEHGCDVHPFFGKHVRILPTIAFYKTMGFHLSQIIA